MTNSESFSSPFPSAAQRQRDRESKRDAVLKAAVLLFNDKGFHATSVDDIAQALGVTKPVIYHYIGSKDQVLFHCVEAGLSQLLGAAEKSHEIAGNGRERLAAFLNLYAEIIMDDFGACVIRTSEEQLSPESRIHFRALKRKVDEAIRRHVAEGVADGSVETDNVALAAATAAGAINWTARWFDPEGPLDRSAMADFIVNQLMFGLVPRDKLTEI